MANLTQHGQVGFIAGPYPGLGHHVWGKGESVGDRHRKPADEVRKLALVPGSQPVRSKGRRDNLLVRR